MNLIPHLTHKGYCYLIKQIPFNISIAFFVTDFGLQLSSNFPCTPEIDRYLFPRPTLGLKSPVKHFNTISQFHNIFVIDSLKLHKKCETKDV